MSMMPPTWFISLIAGPPTLLGIGWALSLFWRKVSLAEIFCLVTFWAAILGVLVWIR
jgi:hypothetical protein